MQQFPESHCLFSFGVLTKHYWVANQYSAESVVLVVGFILYVFCLILTKKILFCIFLFLCRVLQSKNAAFPVGSYVVGRCGWRTHTVCDDTGLTPIMADWPQDVSLSLALGAIGMPG